MNFNDIDDTMNLVEISSFLQETRIIDKKFGFDSVDLDDLFDDKEVEIETDLYLPPDNELETVHIILDPKKQKRIFFRASI